MEDWKRVVVAGSAGASVVLLLKGKTAAGLLVAGVGIATLASEYPEKFAEVRDNLPEYAERGTRYLEMISNVVERIGRQAGRQRWLESLLDV
ncbi:MAG TPA: hypothetical protein VJQ82_23565 [Terriglobales bacterium]|nr:hypothetical protein [Terriglobales bacterium]